MGRNNLKPWVRVYTKGFTNVPNWNGWAKIIRLKHHCQEIENNQHELPSSFFGD
jgi:hypothetical protein